MSIVQRKRDPRRYSMHEKFRKFCWTECARGAAFVVATEAGERADAMKVLGKRKPAWSRTAPIVYGAVPLQCANANLPDVFHGSQWASLHRPLIEHMVRHPLAQKVLTALEHTLLPDEAMLQTIAVNSRFRNTIIGNHLRFIEWPQSHGDANKYWASVGPQFHGGPMVLNATLARTKAFKTSAMFARKVDPTVYENDVLPVWDRWMAAKMVTGGSGEGQPGIADNLLKDDPTLSKAQPPPTKHDNEGAGGAPAAAPARAPIPHSELPKRFDHDHDHNDHDGHDSHDHGQGEHDHGEGEHDGHTHSELRSTGAGFVIVFIVLILVVGAVFVAAVCCQDAAAALLRRRARLLPSYTTAARPKWV